MKPVKPHDLLHVAHHHFSLSGGRTSGRMLHDWLTFMGGLPSNSSVVFCNTGKEDDRTLDFLDEMSRRWNVPIIWLEYTRVPARSIDTSIFPTKRRAQYVERQAERDETTHWFREVSYESAHRNGQPNSPFDELLEWMSVLPNPRVRSCSAQLKSRTMARYLWSKRIYEFTSYIGYRSDETDRAVELLKSRDLLPGNTFAQQPFDLRLEQFEGNCDLCFMKSVPKRLEIIRRNPQSAQWWSEWEKKKKKTTTEGFGSRWRREQSYEDLAKRALIELPKVDEIHDPSGCVACTTGAMSWKDGDE